MFTTLFNLTVAKQHQEAILNKEPAELAKYFDEQLTETNPFYVWIELAEKHNFNTENILDELKAKFSHAHPMVKLAEKFYNAKNLDQRNLVITEIKEILDTGNDQEHPFISWLNNYGEARANEDGLKELKQQLHQFNYLSQLVKAI